MLSSFSKVKNNNLNSIKCKNKIIIINISYFVFPYYLLNVFPNMHTNTMSNTGWYISINTGF